MSSDLSAILEPGMIVRCPGQPGWGLGQVQSNVGGRVTINFEHEGKLVIDAAQVPLELVFLD